MKILKFEDYFRNIGIKKNDNVLVSSNLLKIFIQKKKKIINFNPNEILDALISIVGKSGTILIPTYNWDFCRGLGFHYKKTPSNSGSLGNYALKRKDFERTKNPIYSFAVFGKKKRYLTNLKHSSCFDLKSPFGFLIKNKGKNIFIGIDNIYIDAFTFMHVAEQEIGVNYRFLKTFSGNYIHKNVKLKNAKFTMYVRRLDQKTRRLNPKIKKKLLAKKAYIEKKFGFIQFINIKMNVAHKIIKNDLNENKELIILEK